jgi:hypothetical protein
MPETADPARPAPGPRLEPKLLARVRALLAKAESTTFPEEADALTAKAQQLMSRHAIDAAMLAELRADGAAPEHRRLRVDRPYASAKVQVLAGVATANRCQVVCSRSGELAHVFGFPVDLDVVEVLYTSLLLQATTAMAAAGRRTDNRGRSRTRSFRHAFLLAFATRVAERLEDATRMAVAKAEAEAETALVPVLDHRTAEVDRAVQDAFPRLGTRRLSVSSTDGLAAGRRAGDRADLGTASMGPAPRGDRPTA